MRQALLSPQVLRVLSRDLGTSSDGCQCLGQDDVPGFKRLGQHIVGRRFRPLLPVVYEPD